MPSNAPQKATTFLKDRLDQVFPVDLWGKAQLRIACTGIILVLLGLAIGNSFSAWDSLAGHKPDVSPSPLLETRCAVVVKGYGDAKKELIEDTKTLTLRKSLLTAMLTADTPNNVREYLAREKSEEERLKDFEKRFVSISPWTATQPSLILGLVLGLLLACQLLSRQYRNAIFKTAESPGLSLIPLCLLIAAVTIGVMWHALNTEFDVDQKKTWLAWDSACVNAGAFLFDRLSVLGSGWLGATFCGLIWAAGSKREINIDLTHPDGACGQRRAMRFYRLWLRLPLLILMGGYYLFVAFAKSSIGAPGNDASGYGKIATCLVAIWGVLATRIYLRVQETQDKFDSALEPPPPAKSPKATSAPRPEKMPADPTTEVFGGLWWEVPLSLATTLAAMYSALRLETFFGK